MDIQSRPKKPVITTQASAQAYFENWLKENGHEILRDADGMEWNLTIKGQQFPSESRPNREVWRIVTTLSAKVTGQGLIALGTLDRDRDKRMLTLLGQAEIPIKLKPLINEREDLTEARRFISEHIPEITRKMAQTSLHEVRKRLVARWVDKHGLFGCELLDD